MINIETACSILFKEEVLMRLSLNRLKNIKKALYKKFAGDFLLQCSCCLSKENYTPENKPHLFDLVAYSFYKQNLSLVYKCIELKTNELAENPPILRTRRNKQVEIPPEWVSKFPTKKTKRQRPSKLLRKVKRAVTKDIYTYKNRNMPKKEEYDF